MSWQLLVSEDPPSGVARQDRPPDRRKLIGVPLAQDGWAWPGPPSRPVLGIAVLIADVRTFTGIV